MTNISEQLIEDYLSATQKPFATRLEVVCYIWLCENYPSAQEKSHAKAKELARFLGNWIYLDADRQVRHEEEG